MKNKNKTNQMVELLVPCIEYSPQTFAHCIRVMKYALKHPLADNCDAFELMVCALYHDLLEDTCIHIEDIVKITRLKKSRIEHTLNLLTQNPGESYIDYIKRLRYDPDNKMAYIIKLSDMKDHLMQKETLTDKLKQKYFSVMADLL